MAPADAEGAPEVVAPYFSGSAEGGAVVEPVRPVEPFHSTERSAEEELEVLAGAPIKEFVERGGEPGAEVGGERRLEALLEAIGEKAAEREVVDAMDTVEAAEGEAVDEVVSVWSPGHDVAAVSPGTSAAYDLAERLETIAKRLRTDGTAAVVAGMRGDRFDALLAGLFAGYLAARDLDS
jgi:hypothetical protein